MTQYFDEQPTVASEPREVVWALPDGSLTIVTDRGVFGHGVVDSGTKLLLLRAPTPPDGVDLLDLGCGTGAIALTMARRAPRSRRVGDRRERTRPRSVPGQRRAQRDHERPGGPPRRGAGRGHLRGHLEQPTDPHRQGRAARAVAALAPPPGTRCRGAPGRAEAPRCRLVAPLAHRSRAAHRARRRRRRLPHPPRHPPPDPTSALPGG